MHIWDSYQLSQALNIEIKNIVTNKLEFNSKSVQRGDLFIALKGNNGDGHDYIQDAFNNGANAVIINKSFNNFLLEKTISVPDTSQALLKLAQYKRKHSKAKFIAITGSVGKTTTKEIIKHIISSFEDIYANRGNFNNYLGLPISLASMHNSTKFAIFELGMNNQGEIKLLSSMVKPSIAIMNNIAPVHLANFNNIEELAYAKAEIFSNLINEKIAIIPQDTLYYKILQKSLEKNNITNVYTFGYSDLSNSRIVSYNIENNRCKIKLNVLGKLINVETSIIGEKKLLNIAVVLLLCELLGFDLNLASERLTSFNNIQGRGNVFHICNGEKNFCILDESYNSSPIALKEALLSLSYIKSENKIAVLGDMKELGKDTVKYHLEILPWLLDAKVNMLITIGNSIYELYKKAPLNKIHFNTVEEALKNIDKFILNDSAILCKASRSLNLDKLVKYLNTQNVI